MKKNNSFKTTFYLGLTVLTLVVSMVSLIIFNVYDALSPKFKKDKLEIYIDDVKPEKEIIYDTVYVDKPRVKVNDTPKNVTVVKTKPSPVTSTEKDTNNLTQPVITDTVK